MSNGLRGSRGLPPLHCPACKGGEEASVASEVERLAPHLGILLQVNACSSIALILSSFSARHALSEDSCLEEGMDTQPFLLDLSGMCRPV